MTTYQFSNTNNWQQVATANLVAQDVGPFAARRFFPIPDYVVPVQVESPILAIYPFSAMAENNWRYAGTAYQRIFTGIRAGGTAASWLNARKFYLDQVSILQFQQVSSTYEVVLRIPYWIRQISFVLLEYTGPVTDSKEIKLDEINRKASEILEKIPEQRTSSTDSTLLL